MVSKNMANSNMAVDHPLQEAVRELERRRKSRIFVMIQGGPDHLCVPTMSMIREARAEFGKANTLEILIHSSGGHADVAYAAMNFFRAHCKMLNVIVPRRAKSAATLMCLAADFIFAGEFAEFGPLDVQISDPYERGAAPFSPLDEFKSMEFLREYATELLDYFALLLIERSGMSVKDALHESIPALTGLMAPLYGRIDPSKVGGYRRALAIGEEYAKRLLRRRGIKNADEIVEKLVWGYPSHDFVIDVTELRQLGLPSSRITDEEEAILLPAMEGVLKNGSSVYGFADRARRTKTGKQRKRRLKGPEMPAAQPGLKAI
jgi:hypothetical protein